MIEMKRVGKALVLAAFLTLATGVHAHPGEDAWLLLEQGRLVAARDAATGEDLLSRWILATIQYENDPDFVADGPVARAAVAFEGKDFGTAAEILTEIPADNLDRSDSLHRDLRLGACYVELGRINEAENLLTDAIETAHDLQRPASECFGLLTRGRARVRLRQVEPPREDLQAALDLAVANDAHEWAGVATIALSVVSRLQMDLEDALKWRREALEHYRAAGSLPGQARALHYIATIEIMQGDLTRAMTRLQDADALALEAASEAQHGAILGEMAAINFHLGDFERALDQYREAVRLAPNPWRRGMMLVNIGSILEYRHETEEAVPVLQEALDLMRQVGDHRTETQAMQSLGEAYIELGRFDEGLAVLDEAIATAREFEIPMSEASALEIKGSALLKRGDATAARLVYDEAIERARAIDYFDSLEWALLGRARAARAEGRLQKALGDLEEALAEVAEVRRRSGGSASVTGGITGQAGGITGEMIDLLFELDGKDPGAGHAAHAYAVEQQARARSFLDLMGEAEYDLQISTVPGYRDQEAEILTRIIGLEKDLAAAPGDSVGTLRARLAAAENALEVLSARLRDADPRYARVLYPEPLGLQEVCREVLEPGEVLLEYRLGEDRSFLWVLTSESGRMLALPGREAIEGAVRDLLPLLQDYNLTGPEAGWYAPAARNLYRMLVEPAAAEVAAADKLIICPDGILHYLPFEALLTEDSSAAAFADLPWLVRDRMVRYTPSVSVLALLGKRERAGGSRWLLLGDPLLADGGDAGLFARAAGAAGLPPLPWAGRELEALAKEAPAGKARVLRAADATGQALADAGREGDLRLVHVASHGLFNEARPRYSGLVLSTDPEQGDDGFLSISEVLALELDCDQVVLSACASALGPHVSGEGRVGLTRSFIFAGARSVVSALWDVSGQETARFMELYYARLGTGGSDRDEALAAAKRAMWHAEAEGVDPAHPAFWAAFVLSGAGN